MARNTIYTFLAVSSGAAATALSALAVYFLYIEQTASQAFASAAMMGAVFFGIAAGIGSQVKEGPR